jgi:hypothetical protein
VADGAGRDDQMQGLGAAIIKLTSEVSEMRGEMRSFMDHKLAAEQRVDIRAETEAMIEKAVDAAVTAMESARKADMSAVKAEAGQYTDMKIEKLEARLVAQEERDKKRETDIRIQFISLGVMATAGIVYALLGAMQRGGG